MNCGDNFPEKLFMRSELTTLILVTSAKGAGLVRFC